MSSDYPDGILTCSRCDKTLRKPTDTGIILKSEFSGPIPLCDECVYELIILGLQISPEHMDMLLYSILRPSDIIDDS